jgi:hypothetical protein
MLRQVQHEALKDAAPEISEGIDLAHGSGAVKTRISRRGSGGVDGQRHFTAARR